MSRTGVEPELVEAIARRVIELLRAEGPQEQPARLVDAATLARELGVERDWVYAHAEELGAIRLGGRHGRLRFDLQVVKDRLVGSDTAVWRAPRRAAPKPRQRRPPARRVESGGLPHGAEVRSSQGQRRASGWTPARSPKQHQTGGNPDDEA